MQSSIGSMTTALEWCFSCGAHMPRKREHSSTRSETLKLQLYFQSFSLVNAYMYVFLFLQKKHCVLKTVHPSPLSASRGFFGCKHFSKANDFLGKVGKKEIDWKYLPTNL